MDKTTMRDTALAYAARGWKVFPCHTPRFKNEGDAAKCSCGKSDCGNIGKHPRIANGVKGASTDSEQIAAWWQKWPDANIGVAAGRESGFIVLDIDSQEGEEIFVQHPHAEEIKTYTVRTGNGRQLYFAYPNLPATARIKNAVKILPGIDSRGEGGYVIAPPSLHASGRQYEIVSDIALDAAPLWWLDLVAVDDAAIQEASRSDAPPPIIISSGADYSAYVQKAFEGELDRVASASIGEQSDTLNRAAFALGQLVGAGVLSEGDVENALLDAALRLPSQPSRGPWTRENALPTIQSGLRSGRAKPRQMPAPNKNRVVLLRSSAARAYIGGKPLEQAEAQQEDGPEIEGADEDERTVNEGVYAIQNGRTVIAVTKEKQNEGGSSNQSSKQFVADFAGYVESESRDEDGNSTLGVVVKHMEGTEYHVSVPGGTLLDPRSTVKMVGNCLGHHSMIYAGMEKHLGASVLNFTRGHRPTITRLFKRTGWTSRGEFLIPGLQPPDVELTLAKELSYRVELNPDGITVALDKLMSAHLPSLTPIALAHALLAPLSKLAAWQDEKFALFITGRSGVFKTSWAQMLMCIYGDFGADDKLLRFGAGGTVNALMDFPANAADLPLIIDNFKPGTGNGQKDAQTMVHGLLEGTEKKRMNRDGSLRSTKELRCWLIFTGEDTVSDAASVARMLILNASWPENTENTNLSWCQANGHLLPRIGGAWIQWLLEPKTQAIIDAVVPTMGKRRGAWVAYLRKANPTMINAMRVATSLAICECVWEIASKCPAIADVMGWWEKAFESALQNCAQNMAGYSAQSHEANRYISALRSLIIGQRAYLQGVFSDADKEDRRTFLGWEDEEMVYLLPDVAFAAALDALKNQNGLNGLGQNMVSKQLDQLGYLAKKDGSHFAPKKKCGSNKVRVLFVPKSKFYDDEDD